MLENCLEKDNEAYLKCFSEDMFSGKRIALSPTAICVTFIPSTSFGVSSNVEVP